MANRGAVGFVKKGRSQSTQIPGTKVSTQNSQLLISSGIPSFDKNIGGGLPVGSLVLVDEDVNGVFAKIFMKYFLAEGIFSKQAIHVCSRDVHPERFVSELPGHVPFEKSDFDSEETKDEEMTIAWRYQKMKLVSSQNVNPMYFGHYFDLSKTMDTNVVKNSDVSYWSNDKYIVQNSFQETDFALLLNSIKQKLEREKYLVSESVSERKILRLGLLQLGSPLWSQSHKYLTVFLYWLRALLRNSFSTCLVTVPFYLFEDKTLKDQCVHLSDICVQLESFSGTSFEENPALKDYNGFFKILKWAAINGLVTGGSPFVDLAIKLRRRKLGIEKLHLPPEFEDTTQREQDGSDYLGCGSSKAKLLEF